MSAAEDNEQEELDLLELLSEEILSHPLFMHSREYWKWEQQVAAPELVKLGYEVQSWIMLDGDSFGPLVRGVYLKKDGVAQLYAYG